MGESPPLNALPLRYPNCLCVKYTIYIGYLQVETLENLEIFLPPSWGEAGGAASILSSPKRKRKGDSPKPAYAATSELWTKFTGLRASPLIPTKDEMFYLSITFHVPLSNAFSASFKGNVRDCLPFLPVSVTPSDVILVTVVFSIPFITTLLIPSIFFIMTTLSLLPDFVMNGYVGVSGVSHERLYL